MKKLLLLLVLTFYTSSIMATDYYVDQTSGNDTFTGTSTSTAFKTFNKALDAASGGDSIIIIGEYSNSSYNSSYAYPTTGTATEKAADSHLWHAENTIKVNNKNGSSGNYITIKPFNSNTVLKGDGANIIRIQNSSYIKIIDFEIEGEVNSIPLSTANAIQFAYIDDDGNLTGSATAPNSTDIVFRNEEDTDGDDTVESSDTYPDISSNNILRPTYIDTRGIYVSGSNNIIIDNNEVHHMPGGGIRAANSYAVDITDNEIHNCSRKSFSGTHALVVTKTNPISTDDYTINILRNKIHHNYNEQYSWAPTKTTIHPRIDEGKGISLQRNNTSSWINGQGRILAANNLCYWNGFSGVHTNDGYRIDFINNTSYMNSYTNTVTYAGGTQQGNNIGISASNGNDIKILNNIIVIDTDWNAFPVSITNDIATIEIDDNLIYGYNGGTLTEDADATAVDTDTTTDNPDFFNEPTNSTDTTIADFNLKAGSPALAIANTNAPSDDFNEDTRDSSPDLGALESPQAPNTYAAAASTSDCEIIDLTWMDKSNSEDGFKIKQSTDGTNYTEIHTTAENVQSYQVSGLSGDTQYTFKIEAYKDSVSSSEATSSAATTITCSTLSINDIKNNEAKLELYPNPTSGQATLFFNNNSLTEREISIYDITGRLIKRYSTLKDSFTINILGGAGVYFIKIKEGDLLITKKLIKR